MVLNRIKIDALQNKRVTMIVVDPEEVVWFFGFVMLDRISKPYHADCIVK